MLKAYALLLDGKALVYTDESEFDISEVPDELLTKEDVSVLNTAFPNALRSDYCPMNEASQMDEAPQMEVSKA